MTVRRGIGAGETGGALTAGGNPCFSEVTGQMIPGCVPPGASGIVAGDGAAPAVPTWYYWLGVAALGLVLFSGLES